MRAESWQPLVTGSTPCAPRGSRTLGTEPPARTISAMVSPCPRLVITAATATTRAARRVSRRPLAIAMSRRVTRRPGQAALVRVAPGIMRTGTRHMDSASTVALASG
jgi:hypothetical protein